MKKVQKTIEEIQKSVLVTNIQKAVGVICPVYDNIKTALGLFKPDPNEVFQENVLQAFKDAMNQVNHCDLFQICKRF